MVFRGYRSALVCTTSALALAATSVAPSFAQQAAQAGQSAQSGIALEEMIVTARRVDENVQRVPIAITVFSQEKLALQDIKDAWTLTKSVGGLPSAAPRVMRASFTSAVSTTARPPTSMTFLWRTPGASRASLTSRTSRC